MDHGSDYNLVHIVTQIYLVIDFHSEANSFKQ